MVHKLPIQKAPNGRWIFQPWFYAGVTKGNVPIWSQQQERRRSRSRWTASSAAARSRSSRS